MSKGLEVLNSLIETMPFAFLESNTMKELKIIEKELKALEVIKNKNFDLFYLQDSKDLEMYNDACDSFRNLCYLTQEEYDLLKEVLL